MTKERVNPRQAAGFPGGPGGGGPMAGIMASGRKAKNTKETLKRLWQYLGRQRKQLVAALLLILTGMGFSLAGPYLIGEAIDAMLGKGKVDFQRLLGIVAVMLAIYAAGALANWIQTYMMIGIAQRTVKSMRNDLFAKLQTLPLNYFDSRPHGDIMSRLTNDVENVNNVLTQSVTQLASSVVTLIGSLVMMLLLSPVLRLLSLVLIPFSFLITRMLTKRARTYFTAQQKEMGELNGYIEETIAGQRVVKAFCREDEAIADFHKINRRLNEAGLSAQIIMCILGPMMNFVNNISFAIIAAAGSVMAVMGIISVGTIASFTTYARQFTMPITAIANQIAMIQSAIAGAERVFEVMDEEPEFGGSEGSIALREVSGEVVFKDVDFSYKKEVPVLKNIHLTAKPGQTIALVGPTGAGKTTIVNLLTRFYDIDGGMITVDGKDIRTLKNESLRSSLGIVLQDSYLFSDTVRENIRYGRLDATEEEIIRAARLANAHHFIERLPHGYDTVLTEDAGNLSQGQKQLITIARSILADPCILNLDEATSSVDTRTEMHIQEAMLELMKGRTSFVIAHRLSTIRNADEILVINGGEIIERGNHNELLEQGGFYHKLYNSQFRRQLAV